jgi:hypothetical protein
MVAQNTFCWVCRRIGDRRFIAGRHRRLVDRSAALGVTPGICAGGTEGAAETLFLQLSVPK